MLALAEPRPQPWPSRRAKDVGQGGTHFAPGESAASSGGPSAAVLAGSSALAAHSPLLQPGLAGPGAAELPHAPGREPERPGLDT